MCINMLLSCAGWENRTPNFCLENRNFTIKLIPPVFLFNDDFPKKGRVQMVVIAPSARLFKSKRPGIARWSAGTGVESDICWVRAVSRERGSAVECVRGVHTGSGPHVYRTFILKSYSFSGFDRELTRQITRVGVSNHLRHHHLFHPFASWYWHL